MFATLDARQLGKKTDDEDTFPVTFTASTWEPVCVCGGPDVHPNGSVSYANTCSDPTDTERCDVLPRGAKHLVYGGTTTAASVKCYSATEHPKLAPLGRVPWAAFIDPAVLCATHPEDAACNPEPGRQPLKAGRPASMLFTFLAVPSASSGAAPAAT